MMRLILLMSIGLSWTERRTRWHWAARYTWCRWPTRSYRPTGQSSLYSSRYYVPLICSRIPASGADIRSNKNIANLMM